MYLLVASVVVDMKKLMNETNRDVDFKRADEYCRLLLSIMERNLPYTDLMEIIADCPTLEWLKSQKMKSFLASGLMQCQIQEVNQNKRRKFGFVAGILLVIL